MLLFSFSTLKQDNIIMFLEHFGTGTEFSDMMSVSACLKFKCASSLFFVWFKVNECIVITNVCNFKYISTKTAIMIKEYLLDLDVNPCR